MKVRKDCVIIGSYRIRDTTLRKIIGSWKYDCFYWHCYLSDNSVKKECLNFMIEPEGREISSVVATGLVTERFGGFIDLFNGNYLEAWCFMKKCFTYCYFYVKMCHPEIDNYLLEDDVDYRDSKQFVVVIDDLYSYIKQQLGTIDKTKLSMEQLSYVTSFHHFEKLITQKMLRRKRTAEAAATDSDSE